MNKAALLLLSIIMVFKPLPQCFADEICLKNGRVIQGDIIEKTDDYVKIDLNGISFFAKYKLKDIKKIKMAAEAEEPIPAQNSNSGLSPVHERAADIQGEISSPQVFYEQSYILYIPSGVECNKRYPLLLALHPGADAQSMVNAWKPVSEQFKWVICASTEFKNGDARAVPNLEPVIKEVLNKFSIDRSRVAATGISGGGMGSHMFATYFPELVSAVIINTGRIHPDLKQGRWIQEYPQRKLAVFLASPTDFSYEHMKDDHRFLEERPHGLNLMADMCLHRWN